MAKQVVIETYSFSFYAGLDENGNKKFRPRKTPRIKITYHYDFDADLVGKKERQEVVSWNGRRKTVKYWVSVPDKCTTPVTPNDFQAQKKVAKIKAKKDLYRKLCEEKSERIARYAKMVANWQEITFTNEDRISAAQILKLSKRAQNKKVCKI